MAETNSEVDRYDAYELSPAIVGILPFCDVDEKTGEHIPAYCLKEFGMWDGIAKRVQVRETILSRRRVLKENVTTYVWEERE